MANRELQLAIELCRFARRRSRPTTWQLGHLAELRADYGDLAEEHALPDNIDYRSVDEGGVRAEWICAPESRDDRAMLYLHGGCYSSGSVETHRDLMTRLALAASMRVLGLNYRLAPEDPFPAAVDDASAAYRWLLDMGIAPARIAIAGDSAGGGLALATTIATRDAGLPLAGALVCLSPWVDLGLSGASMDAKAGDDPIVSREMLRGWAKLYLGDHDARTPLASPLYADLHGLPPLLIQVGASEVLLDDATRLAERASTAGVETTLEVWPEMIHVWQTFAAILPEGRRAIARIGEFVRTHLGE
jgi:monoterpene epsilon-lactone hydrolase